MPKLPNWDYRPDGKLLVGHVIRWETATSPLAGLLRIHIAQTKGHVANGGVPIQVVLSPEQARTLAKDLIGIADTVNGAGTSTKQ